MLNVKKNGSFETLQLIIDPTNTLGLGQFLSQNEAYCSALLAAVEGNLGPIATYLFTKLQPEEPVIWLAPLSQPEGEFTWFVGKQPKMRARAIQFFKHFQEKEALGKQGKLTPDIIFYWPVTTSPHPYWLKEGEDEFEVFQDPTQNRDDHSQKRLVLNLENLVNDKRAALRLAERVFPDLDFSSLKKDLEFYTILHSEGHNRGHFLGPWPFGASKMVPIYDPIEEVRSCLSGLWLLREAGASEEEQDNYALTVFLTRFFGYGFNAYKGDATLHENFRETTAGILLWQWLRLHGVINSGNNGTTYSLDLIRFTPSFFDLLREISKQEEEALTEMSPSLSTPGRFWLQYTYPGAQYPEEVKTLYAEVNDEPKQ